MFRTPTTYVCVFVSERRMQEKFTSLVPWLIHWGGDYGSQMKTGYRHCQRENIPRAGCEQEELGPGQQDYIHADTNSPLNYPSFHKLAQPWRLLLPAQESCAATRLLLAFGPGDTRWMLSREDNAELWIQE